VTTVFARVGDLAQQIRGVTYSKSEAASAPAPGFLPVLRAGNITEHGLRFTDLVFVPEARVNARQRIRRNDVLIAASSGSLEVVGKAGRALEDFDGGFGAFCKVLRPSERVDPGYFAHFFKTVEYRRTISSLAAGANINNLRSQHLDDLQIPLPPLVEQRRIAAILDQTDGLRAKRRETLAHIDDLTQSLFLDMFVRDGSEDWPLVTIDHVAAEAKGSIRTGPFGSQLLHSEFVDEGVAVLGIDNAVANDFQWRDRRFITKQKYAKLSRYTVRPGDVLITIMGTCGRCAVVPDDIPLAINTKHLCCITVNRDICLPVFLHASFLSHPAARAYLQRTAKGAIMSGLNMAIIKGMPLTLPPLDLQASFAQRIQAVQASRNLHYDSNEELDSLFASLQARAFSGRL
jgi:type I restriction enzyme S subunit